MIHFPKTHLLLPKLKRQILSHPRLIRALLLLALLVAGIYLIIKVFLPLLPLEPIQQFVSSFVQPPKTLRQTHGRTNFILLGIGGAAHEAGDLTDTIIFVSIDTQTTDVVLLPLPRDLWVTSLKAKLNTAYHYGEQKRPRRGGLILAKAAVGEILDQPIHYATLIDFEAFKQIINLVEGIDINIPRTFDDYYYPIPGKEQAEPESQRYEHLHFDAGWQHLNGETALKFVRSRHSDDPQEGTDFARSQRQQLVILALKDKLLSPKFFLKPSNLNQLATIANQNIQTDFPLSHIGALARLALKFKPENLRLGQLAQDPNFPKSQPLLINPPTSKEYANQWVLTPPDNNWTPIHEYVNCLIHNRGDCNSTP